MITIQKFTFNSFQVNTYLLYDETKECILIDIACQDQREQEQLLSFIKDNNLNVKEIVNTHNHVDHILGNTFAKNTFNAPLTAHKEGDPFIRTAPASAEMLGFSMGNPVFPDHYIKEGDVIRFGNSKLKVLYTPGHADGSICLHSKEEKFVIAGDVLFRDSIGRTDLPTGDYDLLNKNIREKLFSMPDETVVYPGHGPETTIGEEVMNNPFVRF
ncbi:MAG TPA: MBL fold metallo-hydrolase [Bacteroidales bacterium]|nr:MBL fold metallo-hydrolase [Bacteroidales bacterium]